MLKRRGESRQSGRECLFIGTLKTGERSGCRATRERWRGQQSGQVACSEVVTSNKRGRPKAGGMVRFIGKATRVIAHVVPAENASVPLFGVPCMSDAALRSSALGWPHREMQDTSKYFLQVLTGREEARGSSSGDKGSTRMLSLVGRFLFELLKTTLNQTHPFCVARLTGTESRCPSWHRPAGLRPLSFMRFRVREPSVRRGRTRACCSALRAWWRTTSGTS